jgi:enoyl-CoA hydratase
MSVVTIEQRGPVSVIAINRPEKLNAINKAVAVELQLAFGEFDRSEQRVAILTGSGGKAFSAGADVTDLPELWRCVPTVGIATEKPIIAAVSGWCIGGGLVMAMMCDLLVAADNARFSYPEGKVGITGGMIAGLAARIPHKIAMELMLLGEPIDATRAYEVGFANRVVPAGSEVDAAVAMAGKIVDLAPLALAAMKRFVNDVSFAEGAGRAGRALWRGIGGGAQQRGRGRGGAGLPREAAAAVSRTVGSGKDVFG